MHQMLNRPKVYSVLDLFTGIGGVSMAMHNTGRFETRAVSENNIPASKVIAEKFGVHNIGDITKVSEFMTADVIAGGFPCQDIAHSGSGLGLNGARSGLWFHMLRAIQQVKPKGVLIENVDMLRKRGLDVVLQGLAAAGYDAEWYTIRASSIGAPHQRNRLYIIAYRVPEGKQGPEPSFRLSPSGYWLWSHQEDLRKIFDAPFEQSDRWPKPLLWGVAVRAPNWAHRINQIGNGVVVPVVEQLASYLAQQLDIIEEMT